MARTTEPFLLNFPEFKSPSFVSDPPRPHPLSHVTLPHIRIQYVHLRRKVLFYYTLALAFICGGIPQFTAHLRSVPIGGVMCRDHIRSPKNVPKSNARIPYATLHVSTLHTLRSNSEKNQFKLS